MNVYKLTIAYDGTSFCGWQQQPNKRSVIGEISKAFKRAFNTEALLLGASRTDAGVHAIGQVLRCKTPLDLDANKLAWVWNNSLPEEIHIRKAKKISSTFHPHYNVKSKTYYYHFFTQRPLPFIARYGWYCYQQIDMTKLNSALQQFLGTHDFRSFCSAEDKREDTVRTIDVISLHYYKRYGVYRIAVTGHKFLRHMIRRMVGASIAIASQPTLPVHYIKTVLTQKDPPQALPNAPGKGLVLYTIRYKKENS